MYPLPHFQRALHALAPTDRERAHKLGVSLRTIVDYRAGRLPRALTTIVQSTTLAEALARDAHQMAVQGTSPAASERGQAHEPPDEPAVFPSTRLTPEDGLVLCTTITQQLIRVTDAQIVEQPSSSPDPAALVAGHPAAPPGSEPAYHTHPTSR